MAVLDHRLLLAHEYALINPLQVDEDTWNDLPVETLLPTAFQSQPALMPILLPMADMDADSRVALLARSREWEAEQSTPWFSALLASSASLSRIRHHLERNLQVRQRDGTHDLFRYFDPRVMRHLQWILTSDQRDCLLGPVTRWTWRLALDDWHSVVPVEPATQRLRLSSEQQQTLLHLDELNTCLVRLKQVDPDREQDHELARAVHDALAQAADKVGLDETEDRQLFALQTVRFGPRIHQSPELRARLDRTLGGQSTYTVACDDLDDHAMRCMAADLNSAKERA